MSLSKFLVKMFNSSKSIKITDLPFMLLEQVLLKLHFEDLLIAREVCALFQLASKSVVERGLQTTLNCLISRMGCVERHLAMEAVSLEDKLKLNQVHTKLQIVSINLFSVYVLSRHCLRNLDLFTIASVLDEVLDELKQMEEANVIAWPQTNFLRPDMLNKLNLSNAVYEQSKLPFGVYIMDILDLLMGINYSITCDYDTLKNCCAIHASYFTDNTKFLLYLPDFSFMKECQDRKLSQREEEGILKYLLLIVNLYNGMFYKNEEYNNEILLRGSSYSPNVTVELRRRETSRAFGDAGRVAETYEKLIESDAHSTCKRNGGLLLCEMALECNLRDAPFQIVKSYENLRNHLVLEDYQHLNMQPPPSNPKDYGAKIKLKICVQNKCTEGFEVNILDGNKVTNDRPTYIS